jgi:hypothetical protein
VSGEQSQLGMDGRLARYSTSLLPGSTVVKTVDVGQQRTAGGANSAVEVGTVPGRQAVQGLLAGWLAGC